MEKNSKKYKLCVSGSIHPFMKKAERVWGLERYRWPMDMFKPTVFFGMYNIADYWHYVRHLGDKVVVWAGSDIINLKNNYIFGAGRCHFLSKALNHLSRKTFQVCKLFRGVSNFCENELERNELYTMGIEAKNCPTFLEDVDNFPVSFKASDKINVYLSARPGREDEYGVSLVRRVSKEVPHITFHIYGYDLPFPFTQMVEGNIWYEGKVPPEQFNEDIKKFQCGLRCNEHDGFSEIIAKSVLMGQYPISRIKYPMIDSYETEEELIFLLKDLKNKKQPNVKAREFWRNKVNDLPFVNKEK